jgi:hypothetical protein
MVRKNLPNFLYKDDLVNRLVADGQSEEYIKKLGKNELVWLSSEKSLISNIERDDSFNKRTSTLPCYLYTHIVDKDIREKIEEYVQSYSMLYSRGSKSIQTKVERVLKMLKIKDKVKTTEINEYNTTQCCYKCDAKMNILLTKTGNDCLRYRLCTCCSTKTYGKRRNRDVNAAKNMLRLLRLEMDGCPRPLHLTRAA